ncbi:TolC family protein [Sphingobacterium daejeonense]|uniref:TolC family protein n=1 Tax=Sphingobacterium daejeonense TaxID=371142 RepID=UPI0010C5ACAD|nr:TolC family protein [Sphingobacterium daejeonense]VTP95003.1 type I secretion outer membrane protein, TolC family [Sphingobacterium daejeonense]
MTQRYIEFIYLNVLNEWFEKHAERYTSILEITKGLAEAGIVPGADTLLASSSLKNVESNLLQIKGKVAGSRELLKEFTKDFNPADTKITPFLEVIDTKTVVQQEHPLFLMKRNEAESLQLMEKKNQRDHFPRVMLLGGLTNRSSGITSDGYVNPNYSALYNDFANNYFVGVGVTWNLQDLFNSRSQRSSLGLLRQNNEYEQEVIQNEIHSHIAQLEAEIIAADAGIKESNLSRTKAEEAYLLYKARYEGGLINLSDLLQVQEILLQTERQNLMAYLNYWNLMISKSYQQADFSQLFAHF